MNTATHQAFYCATRLTRQDATADSLTFKIDRITIKMTIANTANQMLLHSIRRLCTSEHLVGNQACIIHSSLGIETQSNGKTPFREMIWVYIYTDDPEAFSLLALAAYLGIPQPLIESAMQFVTVFKKRHQPVKVLPLVPSHTDSLNLFGHSDPPDKYESLIFRSHQGTSKSSNAKELAEILSCKNIVDDWNPDITVIKTGTPYQTNVEMP
jgi:hypothetical protein